VSSESIASSPPSVGAPERCAGCGAPLADDQRYCLECGERRTPMSSVLSGGPPNGTATQPPEPVRPHADPASPRASGTVAVLAGVGVLLLAMGVGVLIGRSSSSKPAPASPQVISVGSTPAAAAPSAAAAEGRTVSDEWPSGTSGYTVQLQKLPQSGASASAVDAAKASAEAKGAKDVGVLKSNDFSSLTPGTYVIYSGVYHDRAHAQKALPGLRKSFPSATVISVSNGSASSTAAGGGASSGGSGAGASEAHPAPPTVVEKLSKKKGQSYEQESKNLPNVISTG
jgi:hypothetical protein